MAARMQDERGTTMVELMVGVMIGMVVLTGLTMLIITTMHGTSRVSARVEATQRARLVVTQIIEQLHSACIEPKIAPIYPASTGTSLEFIHATGSQVSAVSPTPTKSVISFAGGTLTQTDYAVAGGKSPSWTWTKSGTRTLLTEVSPVAPSSSIFSYFKYVNGALSTTPLQTPLEERSPYAIQVQVALNARPTRTTVADQGSDLTVRASAVLRLTPPSFNEGAEALPCQ